MQSGSTVAIPAPLAQVRHALAAVDEYPAWNSMVDTADGSARWSMPRWNGTAVRMRMHVDSGDDGTVITLRRNFLWRVTYRIRVEAAGANHTDAHIEVATEGLLGFLVRRLALFASVTCLGTDLSTRARWLLQAPDTSYSADVYHLGLNDAEWDARMAELREMATFVDGDLLIFDSGSARCIIDTERRRFLRVESDAAVDRLVAFAMWQQLVDVAREGDDVVIVPTANAARVRIRPVHARSRRSDSMMV